MPLWILSPRSCPYVIDGIAVYRAAEVLTDQHGNGAIDQAETRASDMLARGERDGRAVWERILAAV